MLNPFPELFVFSFFAPTVLRMAAACVFFYLAYVHYRNRDAIGRAHFPIVHGVWVAWLAVLIEVYLGFSLFIGYYTQIAAIIGLLGTLKHLIWRSRYPIFFILPRSTSFLLFAILLSLLATGAGALAFDFPL